MSTRKPKILIYDIETSPNLAYVWGKYQQDVIAYQDEWEILCFAYKWVGDKKVTCVAKSDFKDKTDKTVCKKLWKLFNEADVVIAHNGDAFDQKKATARFVFHGFKPYSPFVSLDTKKIAKKYCCFNSNKLKDLGEYLGLGSKVETGGFDLWLGCMAGRKTAWQLMKKYNKQDVVLLEKIYLRLRPWMTRHPNLSLLKGERSCPNCGSKQVVKRGVRANHRTRQQQYHCKKCKAWFLGPFSKKVPEYGG